MLDGASLLIFLSFRGGGQKPVIENWENSIYILEKFFY